MDRPPTNPELKIDNTRHTGEDWTGFPKCVLLKGNLRGDSLADGMAHVRAALEARPGK